MLTHARILVACAALLVLSANAAAQTPAFAMPDTPAGRTLATCLAGLEPGGAPPPADLFGTAFLTQVPPDRLAAVYDQLRAAAGRFIPVKIEDGATDNRLSIITRAEKQGAGFFRFILGLDADGKIETFLVQPASDPDSPIQKALLAVLAMVRPDSPRLDPALFAPDFLKAVPFEQLRGGVAILRLQTGGLKPGIVERASSPTSLVSICRAIRDDKPWRITLSVDETGLINGMLLQPAPDLDQPPIKDWADLDSRFRKLAGEVSFRIAEIRPDGAPDAIHAFNPGKRLAIGSTFKLYILGALAEWMHTDPANAPKWDRALAIDEARKSLPSGTMQNEPAGKEFPIQQFADLMISISDNSATDHLLHLVGRERVEAYMAGAQGQGGGHAMPPVNTPFLGTRDLFILKLIDYPTLADSYLKADIPERRKMLAFDGAVGKHTPSLEAAGEWSVPRHIDSLEWFASADDLVALMADILRVSKHPGGIGEGVAHTLTINPGVGVNRDVWSRVFFKGGSEPGVMNLTWLLTRTATDNAPEQTLVITLGVNNTATMLDESALAALGQAIIKLAESPNMTRPALANE